MHKIIYGEEGHESTTLEELESEDDGDLDLVGDGFVDEDHVDHVDRIAAHLHHYRGHQEHLLVGGADGHEAQHDLEDEHPDLDLVASVLVREQGGAGREEHQQVGLGEDDGEFLVREVELFPQFF